MLILVGWMFFLQYVAPDKNKWFKFPPCNVYPYSNNSLRISSTIRCSGGDLVVLKTKFCTFVVCNIVTKAYKILATILSMNFPDSIHVMVPLDHGDYKILITTPRGCDWLYHSQTRSWQTCVDSDLRLLIEGDAVYLNGRL